MKHVLQAIVMLSLMIPFTLFADVTAPDDFELEPGDDYIEVTWSAQGDDTDYYVISWGESESSLNSTHQINDASTESYTIKGLDEETTYYVELAAYDEDGNNEDTVTDSTTTLPSSEVPSDFDVSRDSDGTITGRTENQVVLVWDRVTSSKTESYLISYGTSSAYYTAQIEGIAKSTTTYTVTGLTASTRYYFIIQSVDEDNELSVASDELIVDTLTDTMPPNAPNQPSTVLSGHQKILVSFGTNNDGMADLKGYNIYISNNMDASVVKIDIGDSTSENIGQDTDFEQITLQEDVTYQITITAYDQSGNESDHSLSNSVTIEDIKNIILDNDDLKSSCFISTLTAPGKALPACILLLVAGIFGGLLKGTRHVKFFVILGSTLLLYNGQAHADMEEDITNNSVGVKVGYMFQTETLLEDTYEDDYPIPVTIFYERMIGHGFFADAEVGFYQLEGYMQTATGSETTILSKLNVFPCSVSAGYKHFFTDYIYIYGGGGLDLWQLREKVTIENEDEKENRNVSGYHVKAGVAFLSTDTEFFQRIGLQFEVLYTQIDGFGENDLNFGGLTLSAGYFYRF